MADESRRAAPKSAAIAADLARLAVGAAHLADGSAAWRSRLEGFARASLANALRVEGKLVRADAEWQAAWRLWQAGASGDSAGVLPEWRLLDMEASLRRDARQYKAALALLDRAESTAPPAATGLVLINRASVLEQSGDIAGAVAALRRADLALGEGPEPRVRFAMKFQLCVNLCHLGAHQDAAAELPDLRRCSSDLGNDLDLLRVVWLAGRVAAGLGDRVEACAALEQVRDQLTARHDDVTAALVSLELAVLYLEEGRLADVQALALTMGRALAVQGLKLETAVSLRLFCDAVRGEAASIDEVRRLLQDLSAANRLSLGAP